MKIRQTNLHFGIHPYSITRILKLLIKETKKKLADLKSLQY